MIPAAAAARIVLVRSVDEADPHAVLPEAAAAAGAMASTEDAASEADWLARRAAHLLAGPLAGYAPLLALAEAPRAPAWMLAIPFALGAFANYLGPSGHIHVLYNPIAALVGWNLALYALLALTPLWRRRRRRRSPVASGLPASVAIPAARPAAAAWRPHGLRGLLLRRLVPSFFVRLRRGAQETGVRAANLGSLARGFWSHWLETAPGLPWLGSRRLLHVAAATLAAGAVAGMFVRGVFFEYAVVWRSTFVRDPETIAGVLRVVLGPAAALLAEPLPDAADATRMLDAAGLPAARWIGLWALTAGLFVVIPRCLLAAGASLRRRVQARRVVIDLEDPYYAALLAGVRKLQIERIETAIREDVREQAAQLASTTADFVCSDLFDARLVPQLRAFREKGGSVASLEQAMEAECQAFEPALEARLGSARAEFETALRSAIEQSIDERFGAMAEGASAGLAAGSLSRESLPGLGGSVGREVSNAVGAAVSAGVSLVVATLSGGFGHHLGAAVLVTLLHTTGPVGFLIGGLGGLAVAAAGWYAGRDRIAGGMRELRLPPAVARLVLRKGSLEKLVAQGREQCRTAVRERIGAELEPLVPQLAESIWPELRATLPVAAAGRPLPDEAEA